MHEQLTPHAHMMQPRPTNTGDTLQRHPQPQKVIPVSRLATGRPHASHSERMLCKTNNSRRAPQPKRSDATQSHSMQKSYEPGWFTGPARSTHTRHEHKRQARAHSAEGSMRTQCTSTHRERLWSPHTAETTQRTYTHSGNTHHKHTIQTRNTYEAGSHALRTQYMAASCEPQWQMDISNANTSRPPTQQMPHYTWGRRSHPRNTTHECTAQTRPPAGAGIHP